MELLQDIGFLLMQLAFTGLLVTMCYCCVRSVHNEISKNEGK